MISLIIMSFFVGKRLGYIQGYSYVNKWYEEYVDNQCICSETPRQPKFYQNNSMDFDFAINVSNLED